MDTKRGNWTIKQSALKYDNPWITLTEYAVLNPNGGPGIYGEVHFKNLAIGVIPIDEEGNIYLVKQFRFVLDQESIEIPEGGGALNTDPLLSAQRELKEETGLTATYWEKFMELHLSNSVTDEKALVYLAKGLQHGTSAPEDTEDIAVIKLPLKEAYQMVIENKITDAISVAAILKLQLIQLEKQFK